jgi:DNA-binding transcriptional MerR regulator
METHRQDQMTIGQFAQAARLSHKALRLCHRLGILQPAYIDLDSGYRYYLPEQLARARLVRLMRQLELPLATIGQITAAHDHDPGRAREMAAAYVEAFEARAAEVRRLFPVLINALSGKEKDMTLEVEVREVGPRRIASLSGRVKVGGLDGFIRSSLASLREEAQRTVNRLVEAPFGIYHGPINEDEDGPIEVCWQLEGEMASAGEMTVRTLPGGRLAAVAIHGPDCYFPAILSAYDAACQWIVDNGYELAGSPQEAWLSQPGEEEQMEIRWPFR